MHRHIPFTIVAAALLSGAAGTARAQFDFDNQGTRLYIQGNLLQSFSRIDSGGFNTEGGFVNTGSDEDEGTGLGVSIGSVTDLNAIRLRLEAEGMVRENLDFRTNSFPGPPGPPEFFYDVKQEDVWTAMGNIWIDVPVHDDAFVYLGGGLGAFGTQMTVNDGVVVGQGHTVDFAFQVGAGVILQLTESIELDLGYRYLDVGQPKIGLYAFDEEQEEPEIEALPPGASHAGQFFKEEWMSEIMLSIRILLP